MCLETCVVKEFVGYKLMAKRGDSFSSSCLFGEYQIGKWYKSGDYVTKSFDNVKYVAGFHIFTTIGAAANWSFDEEIKQGGNVVVRVKYRTILATGTQNMSDWNNNTLNVPCVVAREMMIVSIVPKNKVIKAGKEFLKNKGKK